MRKKLWMLCVVCVAIIAWVAFPAVAAVSIPSASSLAVDSVINVTENTFHTVPMIMPWNVADLSIPAPVNTIQADAASNTKVYRAVCPAYLVLTRGIVMSASDMYLLVVNQVAYVDPDYTTLGSQWYYRITTQMLRAYNVVHDATLAWNCNASSYPNTTQKVSWVTGGNQGLNSGRDYHDRRM